MCPVLFLSSLLYSLVTHSLIEVSRRFLLSKPPGRRMVGFIVTRFYSKLSLNPICDLASPKWERKQLYKSLTSQGTEREHDTVLVLTDQKVLKLYIQRYTLSTGFWGSLDVCLDQLGLVCGHWGSLGFRWGSFWVPWVLYSISYYLTPNLLHLPLDLLHFYTLSPPSHTRPFP